jgi:hypothetical protein
MGRSGIVTVAGTRGLRTSTGDYIFNTQFGRITLKRDVTGWTAFYDDGTTPFACDTPIASVHTLTEAVAAISWIGRSTDDFWAWLAKAQTPSLKEA